MNASAPIPWPEPQSRHSAGAGFRAVFGNAPMGVARCDRHGTIVEMNPVFERTFGRNPGDTCPLRLCDLVGPEERDELPSLVQELFDARRDSFHLQARGTGGDQHATEWIAWRISDAEGGLGDCLMIVGSLQEDRQDDERLRQSQRWETVGRLSGGVFHDFNNLLTGVTLYCDLMLASLESGDRLRRYADEIRSAVLQASGLVRQLLTLARQSGAEGQVLSLNDVAAGMRNLLGRLIGENIAFRLHLVPDLGSVKIDPAQAQQILLNLVLNARDALPEGGNITLETSNCRLQSVAGTPPAPGRGITFPCVLLVVADNGRGMDAETRQRVFEPFFTTKSAGQGNGLGLATVHSIVSRNGGLVYVDSEPGGGTRMMILLPRVSEPAADVQEIPSPDSEVLPQTRLQIKPKELTL